MLAHKLIDNGGYVYHHSARSSELVIMAALVEQHAITVFAYTSSTVFRHNSDDAFTALPKDSKDNRLSTKMSLNLETQMLASDLS